MSKISELIGRTLTKVERSDHDKSDLLEMETGDGKKWRMYHSQDCCESVRLEDGYEDLRSLIGQEIKMAEESTNKNKAPMPLKGPQYPDSYTWTFYRITTDKGQAVLRWLGESNGYYSEDVNFEEVKSEN